MIGLGWSALDFANYNEQRIIAVGVASIVGALAYWGMRSYAKHVNEELERELAATARFESAEQLLRAEMQKWASERSYRTGLGVFQEAKELGHKGADAKIAELEKLIEAQQRARENPVTVPGTGLVMGAAGAVASIGKRLLGWTRN